MTVLFGVNRTPLLTSYADPTHDNCLIHDYLKGRVTTAYTYAIDSPFGDTIPIKKLRIDVGYQRPEDFDLKNCIKNLDKHQGFSYKACVSITVYQRSDGYYYVVDGLHRVIMAIICGLDDIPATVIPHLSTATLEEIVQTESNTFLALNQLNKKVSKNGTLKAGIVAGDKEALFIQNVLNQCGWFIKDKAGDEINGKPISSYGYIVSSWQLYGPKFIKMASKLVQEYGFTTKPSPTFVSGLALFLFKILPTLKEEIQEDFLNFIKRKHYASLTQRHYTEKVCYGLPAETVATRLSTAFNNYAMSVLGYKKRPIKVTTIKQFGLSDEYIRSFKS